MIPYYQNYISCFLEDIDPISKIFKNLLDGSSGFCGSRLFQHLQFPVCKISNVRFRNFRFPNIIFFKNDLGCFLDYLECSRSPKIKIFGLGCHGHVRKSPNHENEGFSSSPVN